MLVYRAADSMMGPDLKLFILVGWDRSSSSIAWSNAAQLMIFFCFRFPVVLFDRPGIFICHATRWICWVLVFASSLYWDMVYVFTVMIHWRVRGLSCEINNQLNVCTTSKTDGEVCAPISNSLLTVPRRQFCGESLLPVFFWWQSFDDVSPYVCSYHF